MVCVMIIKWEILRMFYNRNGRIWYSGYIESEGMSWIILKCVIIIVRLFFKYKIGVYFKILIKIR